MTTASGHASPSSALDDAVGSGAEPGGDHPVTSDDAWTRSRWYWPAPDPGKVELFARLLSEAFPDGTVSHGPDLYPDCWAYRVTRAAARGPRHRVIVMREFFESHDWTAIPKKFHDWRLARTIGARSSVVVTEVGPDVSPSEAESA